MTFFPEPTGPGDHFTGLNNFTKSANSSDPKYQYDIKIDHMFSSNSRLNGRYSRRYQKDLPAKFYDNPSNGFYTQVIQTQNAVIEHTWAVNSSTVWVNRIGVDRVIWPRSSARFDPTSIGLPSILKDAMGISIFPRVEAENYLGLGTTGWTDSNTPHTMYQLASSLSKVTGPHNLKFGGEIRPYYSAYFQPGFPGGFFQFNHLSTAQDIFNPDPTQGNGLASLLLGFGDPYSWGGLNIQPSTATHSKETAFFAQDDWRVTQRLTVNMGLRYEWSSPYTMRHDLSQIADFTADTGIDVPGVGRIHGMNQFVNSRHRTISNPSRISIHLSPARSLQHRSSSFTHPDSSRPAHCPR